MNLSQDIKALSATSPEALPRILNNARQAQLSWAQKSFSERAKYLDRIRKIILDNHAEICGVISRDQGKPINEALSTEIFGALESLSWNAKQAEKILATKSIQPSLLVHKKLRLEYHPLGVVGIISPWNYPFTIPIGELASALMAGNGVIIKPSEVTPQVSKLLESIFTTSGLPENLVNFVFGGPEVGEALVRSGVDKIFFTGSTTTGKKIMATAANSLTPVCLELGGKDALIVREDASIDHATSLALWGGMANAGQTCASVERVFVHEKIFPVFTKTLQEKVQKLRTGKPQNSEVDVGRITFENQKNVYERQILEMKSQIQKRDIDVIGAATFSDDRANFYPTIVVGKKLGATAGLEVHDDETFGPVFILEPFSKEAEIAAHVNTSRYGLNAYISGKDRSKNLALAQSLHAGSVLINDVMITHAMPETPWGGIKESGMGRVHGAQGLEEMSRVLHICDEWINLGKSPWWFPYTKEQYKTLSSMLEWRHGSNLWARTRGLAKMLFSLIGFYKNRKAL